MRPADVLAATRPSQVVVTCFAQTWHITLDRAAEWVGAIGYDLEGLSGVFPGGISEDELDRMWDAGREDPDDAQRRWRNAARVSVQRGSGRDWWWTVNLIRKVLGIWPYINGQLLLAGVDAEKLNFASWCDATFMLLWTNQDEEGRTRLDLELSMRPQGVGLRMSGTAKKKMLEGFAAD